MRPAAEKPSGMRENGIGWKMASSYVARFVDPVIAEVLSGLPVVLIVGAVTRST